MSKNKLMFFIILISFSAIYIRINGLFNVHIGSPQCLKYTNNTEALRDLIYKVTTSLEKHNVTYWLDYGTMLGAYR